MAGQINGVRTSARKTLSVKSQIGIGSVFTLRLPASTDAQEANLAKGITAENFEEVR